MSKEMDINKELEETLTNITKMRDKIEELQELLGIDI